MKDFIQKKLEDYEIISKFLDEKTKHFGLILFHSDVMILYLDVSTK